MSLTADQWHLVRALMHGWPLRALIADFETAKHQQIESMHGIYGHGVRAQVTRNGIEGSIDGREVAVTWTQLRRWIETLPADLIEEAQAIRTEWGRICHQRTCLDDGYRPLGPSYADKHIYGPLTRAAANAVDCDHAERAVDARDRAILARCEALVNEPTDLLDLLAASLGSTP